MNDLRAQLQNCIRGRVCLVGIGNIDSGDDGFGVRLAQKLNAELVAPTAKRIPALCIVVAGTTPEHCLGRFAGEGWDHVIFLDAVELGAAPGAVVFLEGTGMTSRFPQVSTHKLSLGILAKWVEGQGAAKAWLLGVQPESLRPGRHLTPVVEKSLELLAGLLVELLTRVPEMAKGTGLHRCGTAGKGALTPSLSHLMGEGSVSPGGGHPAEVARFSDETLRSSQPPRTSEPQTV